MKAIIWTKYGPPDVLQLQEVEKPTPKDNEVLIKIYAATVFAGDCGIRSFDLPFWLWFPLRFVYGLRKPRKRRILGQELSGVIESVGKDVTQFKKGDQVFAPTDLNGGAYAQYVCLRSSYPIALKPSNMTYEEAATVPVGGLNALHFMRKANLKSGEKVLINGAGGGIGTVAVQLAKYFAAEVTVVDSAQKLDMLRSIGADHVIDYTKEDFAKNGKTYDVIFDAVGKSSFSRSLRSLNPNGRYLLGNPPLRDMIRGLFVSMFGHPAFSRTNKKVISSWAGYRLEALNYLKELIVAGHLKAVIDRRYPLEEIVEAHSYVETGQKAGNVVITVGHSNKT